MSNLNEATIYLNHGAGGRDFDQLLREIILPALGNPILNQTADGAILPTVKGRLVMATDSHVVSPRIFPGGSLGKLAFCGTVNDLAMMGAKPLYLTLGMIIEEGFQVSELEFHLQEIATLSKEFNIPIVAGDTKVVERGNGDGLFLSTTGLGHIEKESLQNKQEIQQGDVIMINGTIGDHGVAILSARENLDFKTTLKSDCAALHELTQSLWNECEGVKVMRDPTRGGVAAALNELAHGAQAVFNIEEEKLPIAKPVASICELMGLDPLELANEGKFLTIVKEENAQQVLKLMKQHPLGEEARVIGTVQSENKTRSQVLCETILGGSRIISWPSGHQLPRIC